MKFFFPDASDLVDPSFDFLTETRSPDRIRQRDDQYAHEVFPEPPFDGLLVSKAIVDGAGGGGRYTMPQRQRLAREGIRSFLRLDERESTRRLETMGDCGAFSYVRHNEPPYTVSEVLEFYELCGFDYGLSVDHVILEYDASADEGLPGIDPAPEAWRDRQGLTLQLAAEFLSACEATGSKVYPMGVAQGWSPNSYAHAVGELQKMGYDYIALGGVVPLKSVQVLSVLERVNELRMPNTRLHLLGITRCEHLSQFIRSGVVSFDSTSPLRQAFKDATDNYYTPTRTFPALRVPQVEGNTRLRKRVCAGQVHQEEAIKLEADCLESLRSFDLRECDATVPLACLEKYELLCDGSVKRQADYSEVLAAQPWRECGCAVCEALGIDVMLFRGAERNRRRGFHNLYVFNRRLLGRLAEEEQKVSHG